MRWILTKNLNMNKVCAKMVHSNGEINVLRPCSKLVEWKIMTVDETWASSSMT
jgi:hypothetical protein